MQAMGSAVKLTTAAVDQREDESQVDGIDKALPSKSKRPMKTTLRPVKRSFSIRGHRTSISLEGAFWDALREQAEREKLPVARVVADIDSKKGDTNLSSAIRVWILNRYRSR
jgi:predicted DNA-binding ribbon-helix-helix protein